MSPAGVLAHPLIEIHRLAAPCLFEQEIENDRVIIQTFIGKTQAGHIGAERVAAGGGQISMDAAKISPKKDGIAKILNSTPRPGLAKESARFVPHRSAITIKIQHQHAIVGNGI